MIHCSNGSNYIIHYYIKLSFHIGRLITMETVRYYWATIRAEWSCLFNTSNV